MKIVQLFNHKYHDFYAKPTSTEAPSRKFLLCGLLAYTAEIIFLIVSTVNLFLNLFITDDVLTQYVTSEISYLWLSFICQGLALSIYCYIISNQKTTSIFRCDYFYLFLFLIVRLFVTLKRFIYTGSSGFESFVDGLISLLILALFAVAFAYYVFYEGSFINSYKRIAYQNGFFRDDGAYLLVSPQKISKEKVCYFLTIIIFWAMVMINVSLFSSIISNFLESTVFIGAKEVGEIAQESKNQAEIQKALNNPSQKLFMIFAVLIKAPIMEELLFRQVIMKVAGLNWTGVIASSFIFALTHLDYEESILIFLPYFIPPMALGFVYMKFKNIFFTIGIHSLYNLFSLIMLLYKMNLVG